MSEIEKNKKIFLHICCAGCGAFVSQLLVNNFKVTLFYYNPNIFPRNEFDKRVHEVRKIADKFNLELIIGKYDHEAWLEKIKGHESDPEKGKRCLICYRDRLEATAKMAKLNNFLIFTSTLTISPYKLAKEINNIGRELSATYEVGFLEEDFKKKDGFKKSIILSQELGIYRQNYCGCEFSHRQ